MLKQSLSKYQKAAFSSFTLHSIREVPSFNLKIHSFSHNTLKTPYYHIEANDPNNLFSITFKTLPSNHKGIPHILEHLALCGSEQYPIRDPFFKMIKRSLNTFMNAFTCPDLTCYPFSTQNKKDFYNLMNIYLDASLNPLLKKDDFLQEGWRLDFDPHLTFKGVVFNEMKGVYQNHASLFGDYLIHSLFDSEHVYYQRYGGDPTDIPLLSYEELKAFHSRFYHPSNAKVLTYGNMDPQAHMEVLEKYLNKFQFLEIKEPIRDTPIQKETVTIKVPSDSMALDKEK